MMRKILTITAATVLSLGVLGGGIAVAGNGIADQDRDRTQSCSQDCDGTHDRDGLQNGMENEQSGATQERQHAHERDGAGEEYQHQYQHQYRHQAQSGNAATGEHHFGATRTPGDGDCCMADDN